MLLKAFVAGIISGMMLCTISGQGGSLKRGITASLAQGFTLIELMIALCIIGILATVAIPAYTDYLIKARVGEMVNVAGAAKTSISEYIISKNAFPADAAAAGVNLVTSPMVASMTVGANNGVITINSSAAVTGTANALQIILTPINNGTHVSWVCTSSGVTKYAPASCR